jgi:exodeoxyribonuclease VII small subunit
MSTREGAEEREDITFEEGYEELKGIVARLGEEDVPVHEMFAGFRRGKGLEQALRGYLADREGELSEIEQGNNLPEFNIVAPSQPSASSPSAPRAPLDEDFLLGERPNQEPPAGAIDQEIPF